MKDLLYEWRSIHILFFTLNGFSQWIEYLLIKKEKKIYRRRYYHTGHLVFQQFFLYFFQYSRNKTKKFFLKHRRLFSVCSTVPFVFTFLCCCLWFHKKHIFRWIFFCILQFLFYHCLVFFPSIYIDKIAWCRT